MVSAAERAHAEIRSAIVSGEIASGSMISENDMAQRVGVSRTPVRAAILRLQDEGWLTIFPKRGALVREIGAEEASDIADARRTLESSAVRRVDPATRARLVEHLASSVDEQRRSLEEGAVDRFVECDIDFHRRLVSVGGNPILLDFYDRLRERQALMISRGVGATADRASEILREHRSMVESIGAERWDEFDAALSTHLMRTRGAFFGDAPDS